MVSPSGEQIEIVLGDQRAVVVEVGGGLREYSAAGRDILDGYGVDEMCPSGRGQVLMPWPNRLEDGSYEFEGERHQLTLDEPGSRNAIHGLVRWAAGRSPSASPTESSMEHTLHPRPGYPFSLALAIEYRLSEEGLVVQTTATNVGSRACPFGSGAHPYLPAGTPTVDSAVLRVPAGTVLQANERGIPVGEIAGRGDRLRLPAAPADRHDPAGPLLHRSRARRRRDRARDAPAIRTEAGLSLWVDEALPLRDAVHGRPSARCRPPQPRGRADDVPPERVPDGTRSDPPREWPVGLLAGGASTPRNRGARPLAGRAGQA